MKLVPVINISVILLLLLIVGLLWNTIDKIHLIVLTFLCVGLFLSVNWVAIEYAKIVKSEKENGDNQNISSNNITSNNSGSKKSD